METKIQRFYRVMKLADKGIDCDVSIIDALEFRRDQYCFTRSEFAEILQMRPSHYSEFISGKRGLPKNAMRRAAAIGVPEITLLAL